MNSILRPLLDAGCISPLSFFFARFVTSQSGPDPQAVLALSAALASERSQRGDVCLELSDFAGKPLFESERDNGPDVPPGPALEAWLAQLRIQPCVGRPGETKPLILDGERLYLYKFWNFENSLCEAVLSRLPAHPIAADDAVSVALTRLFPDSSATVTDWQKVACAGAAIRRLSVISGGPGTGKTATVVKILALLLELDPSLHIRLAAPTGKAAARLSDAIRLRKAALPTSTQTKAAIPEQAATIHRLLGYNGRAFRHHHRNPLVVDCLIVDEASMIDLPLMARLFQALPADARLILLGDRDQLASVEAGSVLGDLTGHGRPLSYSPAQAQKLCALAGLQAEQLPTHSGTPAVADALALLRTSYRFGEHSGIGNLALAVNQGAGTRALEICRGLEFKEVTWIEGGENAIHAHALHWAHERYSTYLHTTDIGEAFQAFERVRVLCAVHDGPFGVTEFNRRVEHALCDGPPGGADRAFHGKPVMVTANDYETGLFNGDVGLLWRAPGQELRAYFKLSEDRIRDIAVRSLPEHVTAWALTVHKSQGSEFEQVLLVLPAESNNPVLNRELIYTGVTRASKTITVHATPQSLTQGIGRQMKRSSGLAHRLGWTRPAQPD